MIKNLTTGCILPQFNVIYDTKFKTVPAGYEENEAAVNHISVFLTQDQQLNALDEADAIATLAQPTQILVIL